MSEIKREMVPFRGRAILTFAEEGEILIPIKPLCEEMGLGWSGQHKKIRRNERFNSVARIVKATGADGKQYDMLCLPMETALEWLQTVNPKKADPHYRPIIREFRQHVGPALRERFYGPVRKPEAPRFYPEQIEGRVVIVPFLETEILTVIRDGVMYGAIEPLCEKFGLDWEYRRQSITYDSSLDAAMKVFLVKMNDGTMRRLHFLPLDQLNVWLTRIREYRFANPQQELIRIYQLNLPRVLYEYRLIMDQTKRLEHKPVALLEQNVGSRPVRMRRRHYKVNEQPEEIRQEVDAMLVGGKTYQQIADYTKEKGHPVSQSAVQRYAQEVQRLRENGSTGEVQ